MYVVSLIAKATKKIAPKVTNLFLSGILNLPNGLVPSSDLNLTSKKWAMNAAPIPGMDSKIASFNPKTLHIMTADSALTIITIAWVVSGSNFNILRVNRGMNIPPSPYTAITTSSKTESPPGTNNPPSEIAVANAATLSVIILVFL